MPLSSFWATQGEEIAGHQLGPEEERRELSEGQQWTGLSIDTALLRGDHVSSPQASISRADIPSSSKVNEGEGHAEPGSSQGIDDITRRKYAFLKKIPYETIKGLATEIGTRAEKRSPSGKFYTKMLFELVSNQRTLLTLREL